jgi:O-succinylbenzoic acid--CoA ligase
VIITYGMHWWNAVGSLLNLGQGPDDCWLACLPFFHIGGLSILMRGAIYGMRVLVYDRFDALSVNHALLQERASIISVVTAMLQRLLASLDQEIGASTYPPSLRCVLLGGGPAPQSLLEDCARRGIPAVQTYGMTESCSQAVTLAPEDTRRKLGSAGRPLPTVQIRIMVNGQIAGSNEPGEIMLRGPTITPGYALQPEATAVAFQEGWFATGDWGYLDTEGYLYVLDRRSDLIISGGENIYPAEIEAALLEHPAVAEAGVCGVPHERWGQVPLAFVVLRAGSSTSKEEILAYLATRVAKYKLPEDIRFTSQLPRTSSGKLLRRELPWRT